jgi:hypothetical protein
MSMRPWNPIFLLWFALPLARAQAPIALASDPSTSTTSPSTTMALKSVRRYGPLRPPDGATSIYSAIPGPKPVTTRLTNYQGGDSYQG